MTNGLGRGLALAAARYGRVCSQSLLLVLFRLLSGLARLDTLIERLTLVVGYGCQILNLFHFNLLLVCHFDGFLVAELALVVSLLCEILRRVLSELAVSILLIIALIHIKACLLLSLVLMLHILLILVVLFETVV